MIIDVMNNAVDFLLTTRSPDGFWRDFWTPAGMSDAWVTGYVGAVLAASPLEKGYNAAQEAWSLLACNHFSQDGWGYGPGVPVDSDSTTWALLLAERVGCAHDERAWKARDLLKHYMTAGGVSTYREVQADALHRFLSLPDEVDLSAWFLPHTCVTAAVAGLGQFRSDLTDYLLSAQQDDGSWRCYWWFEPAYATALAATALYQSVVPAGQNASLRAVERAVAWAQSRVRALHEKKPTPFELAWYLRILLLDDHFSAEADYCLNLLLSLQDQNGAWRGTAKLRIPRPDEPLPDDVGQWTRWFGSTAPPKDTEETLACTFTIYSLDQRGIFTTATVLAALQELDRDKL